MSFSSSDWNIRQRRLAREIEVRYRALLLAGLQRRTPASVESWKARRDDLIDAPLSESALGTNVVTRGPLRDDVESVNARIRDAEQTGFDWERDLFPIFARVIREVDVQLEGTLLVVDDIAGAEAVRRFAREQAIAANLAVREFSATSHRTFVCSDVHLGIAGSMGKEMRELFSLCERGDSLVLLGDILDFWIDSDDDTKVVEAVVAQWKDLYRDLERLRGQGVSVIYVPGNHDSFVFTIEAAGHVDWTGVVLKWTPALRRIRDAVGDFPLVDVADISYPFWRMVHGDVAILLTHGHAHEAEWRLINGSPELAGTSVGFVSGLSAAISHRFARQLRHWFNFGHTNVAWAARSQDLALIITNRHLQEFGHARIRSLTGKREFADYLEQAFRRLCVDRDPSEVKKVNDWKVLQELDEWHRRSELKDVRAAVDRYIQLAPNALNYRLTARDDARVDMATEKLRDLGAFQDLVFGHFHQPRDEPPNHDSGCFYANTATGLQLNPDGVILRPTT